MCIKVDSLHFQIFLILFVRKFHFEQYEATMFEVSILHHIILMIEETYMKID